MKRYINIYYSLVATQFWFAIYYDWNFVKVPGELALEQTFAGRVKKFKYLTFWNALLQGFFFTLCLLCNISRYGVPSKTQSYLVKLKEWMFACLAFPLSMFVGITFWGIYAIDRELIFPKALDDFFPLWLNHAVHTNIILFMLIELVTSFRRYPRRRIGIASLTSFMSVYLIWIHIIYLYSGYWIYPILQVLNIPLRIIFFIILLSLCISLYIIGEKMNNFVWSKRLYKINK